MKQKLFINMGNRLSLHPYLPTDPMNKPGYPQDIHNPAKGDFASKN